MNDLQNKGENSVPKEETQEKREEKLEEKLEENNRESEGIFARTAERDAERAGRAVGGKKVKQPKRKGRWRYWLTSGAIAVCAFGGGMLTRQLSLDAEMRSLIRLKNRVVASYYREITNEEFYNVIFDAVSNQLLDEYSKYMNAEEYAQSRSAAQGMQDGLGLIFSTKEPDGSDRLLVSRVCGNSPAEAAGIIAGDRVVGFGASETQLTASVSFDDFSAFLEGYGIGEEFALQLEKGGVVTIAKAQYVENYVFYRTKEKAYLFTGEKADILTEQGDPLPCLNDDAAYIRLTQFNGAAATEFDGAMKVFKEQRKKDLVLDLRGNGGGYMDIMRKVASYFCKSADEQYPVVAVADYGDRAELFRASDNRYSRYFQKDSRIVVLADKYTASASECLIGCMYDYGAIGYGDICLSEREGKAKTYGKGIMQTTYTLGGFAGDAVKLTTAKICWPKSGNCIHGRGVLPQDGTKTIAENTENDSEIVAAVAALFG